MAYSYCLVNSDVLRPEPGGLDGPGARKENCARGFRFAKIENMLSLAAFALMAFSVKMLSAPAPPARNYTATTWRVEEGLPDDMVQAIAENPQGSLWVGTGEGLARFDGTHFQALADVPNSILRRTSVHCLAVSHDGSLWIGTEGSGLIRYRDGDFRAWTARNGLTDMFVRAIAEDRSGNLWIGTNNGFFRLNGDRAERLDGANGVPALAVNAIMQDNAGRLWIGGSRLMSIHDGRFQAHALPGEQSRNRIKSLLQTRDGAIWVGTVSGLYRSPDGEAPFEHVSGVSGTVHVLRQADDGNLWMGIMGSGSGVWNVTAGPRLSAPLMRIAGTVLSICEDRERNIWVGTQSGMIRYSRTPMSVVAVPDTRNSDFGTVYLDRDGALWSAATSLTRIVGGRAAPYVFPALRGAKVRNLIGARDGSIWIGTDGSGLFHLSGRQVQRYTAAQGLVNNFIRVMVEARDGSMWIGTDEGVSHLIGGRFINYGIKNGLAYFSIRSMIQDRSGGIWIGTDLGVSHLVNGKFVTDAAVNAMRLERVWAIHQDPDGGLWFGSRNHGLYRYRGGRLTHFTVADGLASNSVYSILEDSAGHFWISSPGGVSLLDRRELDAYADEPEQSRRPFSITTYSLPDEDGPEEIFGGVQNAGSIGPRGDVWYPGSHGPVHVTLPESQPWTMPHLAIDQVSADHLAHPWATGAGEAVLSPANSRLHLSWQLLTLSSQQNARFRYRLANFDRKWIGALDRRDASYDNLPPGRYLFEVEAYETNHPSVVSRAELVVIKYPYFYRRWWFLLGLALAALAAAFSAYRVRLNRMKQRFAGVLEERNRIAREIHDTVIQGCTSVSAALEAVSTIAPERASIRDELLDRARNQVRETVNEARRAVWDLRQEPARGMLNESLAAMSARIAREFSVPVRCTVRGRPFRASQPATHEILMIAREAVHNAVQHGRPSAVELTADFGEEALTMEIADDGVGFSPAMVQANGRRRYGLVGMKERAARLGGRLEIRSAPGQGARVIATIPRKCRAPGRSPGATMEEVKAL